MRIYEGSPRQDFEEVLRSIGAFLDERGMREVLLVEAPDGFIVQGLVAQGDPGGWSSDALGQLSKETLTFLDDDIARFMEEAVSRRGVPVDPEAGGYYQRALRVLGAYLDQQRPRDIFFFEQEGAFVVRMLQAAQTGAHHALAEFTREDIDQLDAQGLRARGGQGGGSQQGAAQPPA